jgi:hypothetical protein
VAEHSEVQTVVAVGELGLLEELWLMDIEIEAKTRGGEAKARVGEEDGRWRQCQRWR